jgi:adenylate cyclase
MFAVAMELGSLAVSPVQPRGMAAMRPMHGIADMGMTDILNFQVLPLTTIALTTFILFVMGRRTRALLLSSIQHGARAARLSRYFSPNIATRLAAGDPDRLLAGRRQDAAVVFVDIRDFTSIAENMDPDELSGFLSESEPPD